MGQVFKDGYRSCVNAVHCLTRARSRLPAASAALPVPAAAHARRSQAKGMKTKQMNLGGQAWYIWIILVKWCKVK